MVPEFLWFADIAAVLRDRLPDMATKVPTERLPDEVLRAVARTDPDLATIVTNLGRRRIRSSVKAGRLLGWTPTDAADAVEASARTLIEQGLV